MSLKNLLHSTLLIGATLASSTGPAWAQGPVVDPRTEVVLREMETLIHPGVQPTAGKRVFTRMFDTHSSVHAHWAAYRLARAVPGLQDIALDSELALQYAKLRYEVENWVTYVYAQAWFLLLATEYEKWGTEQNRPDPLRMRPVADEVARKLFDHYSNVQINPLHSNYNSSAWALKNLHQYFQYTGDLARLSIVDGWIQQFFLVDISGTSLLGDLPATQRFFSTYGNWQHLIHSTQPAASTTFWALQDPVPDHHLAVNQVGTAHAYGMTWSRLWSLSDMARTTPDPQDAARFTRSAEAHLAFGMKRHYVMKGDFLAYDHWVGQFAVYALTTGLGL